MTRILILLMSSVFLVGCFEKDQRLDCVDQFLREDNGVPMYLNMMLGFVRAERDQALDEYLSYLDNCWSLLEQEGIKIEEGEYDLPELPWKKPRRVP
jgi:hypothetical protein|tara:strand:+ start:599 stop:889 length:291 start_codon:yes stop_codon:yes gene_type:complete